MKKIIVIICVFLFLISCTIFSPQAKIEINIVGEKTSLENQILGNYEFIGKEKYLLVSVRTIPDDLNKISDKKKKSLLAYQNRLYNRDDYERFMDRNIIGELNTGYIDILNLDTIKDDKTMVDYVKRLVKEENRDRKIIFNRIINITEGLTLSDLNKVEQIFAKKFREEAKEGWMIEDTGGKWVKK